jgi:hypothetical protein
MSLKKAFKSFIIDRSRFTFNMMMKLNPQIPHSADVGLKYHDLTSNPPSPLLTAYIANIADIRTGYLLIKDPRPEFPSVISSK